VLGPPPFIIPIFIPHQGCPHQCVFCNQNAITASAVAPLTSATVASQIEHYLGFRRHRRQQTEIAFFGGNFLGLPSEVIHELLACAQQFVAQGRVDSIRFSTRPDTVTTERLECLKAFRVGTIEVGAQSLHERVLAETMRGHGVSAIRNAVTRLRERRYQIGLQLMVGLPGENPSRSMVSGQRAVALRPDFVRIYPTLVLAGSPLAEWYDCERYHPLTLNEAVRLTKRLYRLFRYHHIRVNRMGLQANQELDTGHSIVAGPYHPSFGHLVAADIYLDLARNGCEYLAAAGRLGKILTLAVHRRWESQLRGHRNQNLQWLAQRFRLESVNLHHDDDLQPYTIRVDDHKIADARLCP
jgi:histone acetyltransferase (RNA polymerase elongator complex component)